MKEAIKSNHKTYIDVTVSTNKPKNSFKGYNKWRKRIRIDIKEEAKQNKANKELKKFLSNFFSIPQKKITITKGTTENQKTIALGDINKKRVLSRLSDKIN